MTCLGVATQNPELRKRFTGPKRPSEVMAHSGDWGLALETAGIGACPPNS